MFILEPFEYQSFNSRDEEALEFFVPMGRNNRELLKTLGLSVVVVPPLEYFRPLPE